MLYDACMLPTSLAAPAVLFIATVGAISVFKAVYIDKRELRCACIGGNSDALFGFVSLTEKLMMTGMAIVIVSVAWTAPSQFSPELRLRF
jgi:hypothetical protein